MKKSFAIPTQLLCFYILAVFLVILLTACTGSANTPSVDTDAAALPQDENHQSQSVPDDNDRDADEADVGVGIREPILWLDIAPPEMIVESTTWAFDPEQIGEDETILSVSPTGKHILTVDRGEQDISKRLLTGKNQLGWMLSQISLYTYQSGGYTLTGRIGFDADADPELNDTLATSGEEGVAWSEDETRVLLTAETRNIRQYMRMSDANIFLIDFTALSVRNLTGSADRLVDDYIDLIPRWFGNDKANFIRNKMAEQFEMNLMQIDIETGDLTVLADLSLEGMPSLIYDYEIRGDEVFCCYAGGFYKANLDGGHKPPTRLLDFAEMGAADAHPYAMSFLSMQISPDKRWACLTVSDQRLINRDIPLIDHPLLPQPDPNSAVSNITGEKWIPCHSVMLYDLIENKLVDPFTDVSLQPDVAIVTAAALAPDGGSLLCAVFGDGGEWTLDSLDRTTLYQIRIDDGSFEAMRVYTTGIEFIPEYLSWIGNAYVLMRADAPRVFNYIKLLVPTAFTRYLG